MNSTLTHPKKIHCITRRRTLQFALAGVAAFFIPKIVRAQAWQNIDVIRKLIGDAKPSDGQLLITLPLVAEDGSAVPMTIKSSLNTQGPFIRRLSIFAPANPTPEVADFEFGSEIGTLNLSTRIRLSTSQTVIAVAHTDDGHFMIAEREVRVTTSGCIAPAQPDGANEMQTRVRLPKNWTSGTTGEVLTMITHPMSTGLTNDSSGIIPPQRIIKTFKATLDDKPVISATYHRSLSINPYLRFDMTPQQGDNMRFVWTEDTGRVAAHQETIRLGGLKSL